MINLWIITRQKLCVCIFLCFSLAFAFYFIGIFVECYVMNAKLVWIKKIYIWNLMKICAFDRARQMVNVRAQAIIIIIKRNENYYLFYFSSIFCRETMRPPQSRWWTQLYQKLNQQRHHHNRPLVSRWSNQFGPLLKYTTIGWGWGQSTLVHRWDSPAFHLVCAFFICCMLQTRKNKCNALQLRKINTMPLMRNKQK